MSLALLVKGLIVLLLLTIVFNLFRALWVMLNPSRQMNGKPMSHYLGRRVLLSALVLLLLLLALASGLISPHSRPY